MSIRQGDTVIANKTNPTVYTAGNGIKIDNRVVSSKAKFIFDMGIAQTEWIVVHGLNDYPSVVVVDSGGNTIEVSVEYLDANRCKVTMNSPCKGTIYFN